MRRGAARLAAGLAAAWLLAGVARADLLLEDGWLAEPPPGARATAAYGTLRNTGEAAIELVGFDSPACDRVELHRSRREGGVVGMERVERLRLGPGEAQVLAPGGTHLMLLGPGPLAAGDVATLTVELADGTRHALRVPVRRRGAAP